MAQTQFAKELEKQTGVKLKFIHPPKNKGGENFQMLLASRELPDIMASEWYSVAGGPQKAIPDGYILDPVSYTHLDVYKRQVYKYFSQELNEKNYVSKCRKHMNSKKSSSNGSIMNTSLELLLKKKTPEEQERKAN